MRRYNLKRRALIEENKLRFSRKAASFQIKSDLNLEEEKLKMAGTMLYWGEGGKALSGSGVDFVNSDPKMITVFMLFLRTIFQIDEAKLRVYLYCYANQKPFELIEF